MSVGINKEAAIPPRRGKVIAMTLDVTAREYDLNAVEFGGLLQSTRAGQENHVCLRFEAIGTNLWLYFCDTSQAVDLDPAILIAAGGAVAFDVKAPGLVPSGQYRDYWIDRRFDRYLTFRGAAAGSVRIHAVTEAQV